MVPLPCQSQPVFFMAEAVADRHGRSRHSLKGQFKRPRHLPYRLSLSAFFRPLFLHAEHRPALFPVHRHQIRNPAGCSSVLKQHSVPLSRFTVDQRSLGNPAARQAAVVIQQYPKFPGSFQALGTIADLPPPSALRPVNKQQIYIPVSHYGTAALTPKHHAF